MGTPKVVQLIRMRAVGLVLCTTTRQFVDKVESAISLVKMGMWLSAVLFYQLDNLVCYLPDNQLKNQVSNRPDSQVNNPPDNQVVNQAVSLN